MWGPRNAYSATLVAPGGAARSVSLKQLHERNGWYRCYAVDNRPWRGPGHPAAAYVYSEDRKGEHPATHLKGFRGVLQVDGYAGFGRLVADAGNVSQLAFCWARRWALPMARRCA